MKIVFLILLMTCFFNCFAQSPSASMMIEQKFKSTQKQVDSIYLTLYAAQSKYTFTEVQANSKKNNLTQSEKNLLLTADSAALKTRNKILALLNVYPLLLESSKKDVRSLFGEYTSQQLSLKQSLDSAATKNEALDNSLIFDYSLNISKLDGKAEKTMNTVGWTTRSTIESLNSGQLQPFQFRFLFKDSDVGKNYSAFLFPYYWVYADSDLLQSCANNAWADFLNNCQNYVSQQIGCYKWTLNTNGKSEKLFSGPYQLIICDMNKSKVIFYDIVQVPVKDNIYPFSIQ